MRETVEKRIESVLKTLQRAAIDELRQALPELKEQAVSCALSRMHTRGRVRAAGRVRRRVGRKMCELIVYEMADPAEHPDAVRERAVMDLYTVFGLGAVAVVSPAARVVRNMEGW